MTPQRPIEQAQSADLRGSWPALRRAAERARLLAAQTGTAVVVMRDGQFVARRPTAELTLRQRGASRAAAITP